MDGEGRAPGRTCTAVTGTLWYVVNGKMVAGVSAHSIVSSDAMKIAFNSH